MAAPFAFPPLGEQKAIAHYVNSAIRRIDRLASEGTNARKLIDHLNQAILTKAFRGELVPQDPNDEPASVLLERIKAERANGLGDGRRRGRHSANEVRA
jgi:type I restriction enzyme S subunit